MASLDERIDAILRRIRDQLRRQNQGDGDMEANLELISEIDDILAGIAPRPPIPGLNSKKKPGRYFAPITIEELREKIIVAARRGGGVVRSIVDVLEKDIKVQFSTENYSDLGKQDPASLIGYQTLPNGFTFCGFWAGGDWENPVTFIAYWDGKRLRGYVPTDGNLWNTKTKEAYGNDEKADLKDIQKRFPGKSPDNLQPDSKAMLQDIVSRILPKP